MLYEIINPSDKIVCEAKTSNIACFCIWMISPNFWVESEEWEKFWIPVFHGGEALYKKHIAEDIGSFVKENKDDIKACYRSFMYWNFNQYKDFKKALDCITDETKKKEFLANHEDNHRSSMNQIVLIAWEYGKE